MSNQIGNFFMKSYPHIGNINNTKINERDNGIAFYKYDGSLIRAEWTKKQGFFKFGTRNVLIDKNSPIFSEAIDVFRNTLEDELLLLINEYYTNSKEVTVFCEFFGEHSFAGNHLVEPHQLVLIDVDIYKQGFISPREFVNNFGIPLGDKAAKIIYEGVLNKKFINDVREGKYPVNEGIVFKAGSGHKSWMCKVKTLAYKEQLKIRCPSNWQQFWE